MLYPSAGGSRVGRRPTPCLPANPKEHAVRRTLLLLLPAVLIFGAICPTARCGWTNTRPPNVVTPDSGKRNHVFYVGEPVAFNVKGDAAKRFEVRDYWGEVMDKGDVAAGVSGSRRRCRAGTSSTCTAFLRRKRGATWSAERRS